MLDFTKLDIHEVATQLEFKDVRILHKAIWGIDDLETIPEHILIAVQKNNGLVLCAYYENKPVGFSFGFCGLLKNGKPYYYSHNLGVIPEFQNSGVGYQIKIKQREHILERGIDLIRWTFDPLESRNAYFNMRLGCIVRQYVRDYYGAMPDQLNSELPSDRLIAEWWLNSHHTNSSLGERGKGIYPESSQVINPAQFQDGFLVPDDIKYNLIHSGGPIFIQVPSNYHEIRKENMSLALSWRMHLRDTFELCFKEGKQVNGFSSDKKNSFYRLVDSSGS